MAADKKKALSYLNQVHVTLSKDDETTKRNRANVDKVLNLLIKHMKDKDPLFSKAFKRITYTGSSFEGLRIREADEFDVNLIISLPIENGEFKLASELPGFVSYLLTEAGLNSVRQREAAPVLSGLEGLFSKKRRLLAQHFRTWFQSVVDRALLSYESSGDKSDSFKVRPSQSGPAKTLYVEMDDGKRLDIDLVPVLEFNYNLLPENFPRYEWIDKYCAEIDKRWVMVPKTPKDKGKGNEEEEVHAWRVHFPDIEKKLIKDCGCIKPVIRLVKALRDAYKWPLSSYAIKTVVVRHRLSKPNKSDWENEHQWTLLLEVLERLMKELQSDSGICYLFDEKLNLVHDLKPVTRENIARCLKKQVLNKLCQSPENTPEVFKIQAATPKLTSSPLVADCKTPDTPTSFSPLSGDVTPDQVDACRPVEENRNFARSLFNSVAEASSDSELESSHLNGGAVAANGSLLDDTSPNSSDCVSEASFADEAGVKSGENRIDKATQRALDFAEKVGKPPFDEVTQSSFDRTFEGSFADGLTAMSGESGFNEVSQSCSEIVSFSHPVDEPNVVIGQQLQFPVSDSSGDNIGSEVPDIEVTLSISGSDGRMLAEATCSTGSCRKLELKVPKSKLVSCAEAASLVVTQRFKSPGGSSTFDALVSLMTSAGRQLAQVSLSMHVVCGVHECHLRVPMPVLE